MLLPASLVHCILFHGPNKITLSVCLLLLKLLLSLRSIWNRHPLPPGSSCPRSDPHSPRERVTMASVERAKVEVVPVLANVHSLHIVHSVVLCFRSAGQYQATKYTSAPMLSSSQRHCDCYEGALTLSFGRV